MYYPINDAQSALHAHNDNLREAKQRHLVRSVQRQQPSLLDHLQLQQAIWATRPQQNRTQRA